MALTGTDLYRDLKTNSHARLSLKLATRLILLQPLARRRLPAAARTKARVIFQSAWRLPREAVSRRTAGARSSFDVCVLAHLRPVKDPFRAALAARRLPAGSRVRVLQVGRAMSAAVACRARAEERRNPRYHWLGEMPRGRALTVLSRSGLMVVASRLEGGANAVSEALALEVPIAASRIAGNVGLLGRGYEGYFKVGDTRGLARLLSRAESDRAFLARLEGACRKRARLVDPRREEAAWARLLRGLVGTSRVSGPKCLENQRRGTRNAARRRRISRHPLRRTGR